MDMYYRLKQELECPDCFFPLTFSYDIGHQFYIAVCPACDAKYEVDLTVKLKKGKLNEYT